MAVNEKKNPDYTSSAENLCNPPEVMDLLVRLHAEESNKSTLEAKLREQCSDLVDSIALSEEVIAEIHGQIKEAIDQFGSYQDIESGEYAVKHRRMSKAYHPEKFFGDFYDRYVPAVLTKAINVSALEGLVKGGLLSLEGLKRDGVITETPTYVYYIR